MSQTALTVVPLKQNNYAVQAGDLALAMAAMDASNGNSYYATGQEILFIWNGDSAPHTVTITSVPDALGRSDSSLTTYSIPATSFAAIQMKALAGWLETGQLIYLATSSALVKIAVVRYA